MSIVSVLVKLREGSVTALAGGGSSLDTALLQSCHWVHRRPAPPPTRRTHFKLILLNIFVVIIALYSAGGARTR